VTVGSIGAIGLHWVEGYRPKPCCYVGVDVGQKVDPTAVAVVEVGALEAGDDTRRVARYIVRHVERLALGTPYPDVARRVVEVLEGVKGRGAYVSSVFVDATGVGQPVVDLLAEAASADTFVSCYFTHGDKLTKADAPPWYRTVGKAWLVSRLQVLLQQGRLQFPASLTERDALVRELLDYEIRVGEDADLRAGAFKVGAHDDLVTAVGLACLEEAAPPWRVHDDV